MRASEARFGTLYLVPNTLDLGTMPAGDALPDVQETLPLGSLRIAAGLTHWVAENAKSARALLKRVGGAMPLAHPLQAIEITELPRPAKGQAASPSAQRTLVAPLLRPALNGHDLGLVSEAGLPAVADPGALLVEAAHAQGIRVCPLSGPSSLMLALAASGLNGQSFAFVGYLPQEASARTAQLRALEALSRRQRQTQLIIETPYRNAALLASMLDGLQPGTRVSVGCGLTLSGGWSRTDTVAGWRARGVQMPDRTPAVFLLLAD